MTKFLIIALIIILSLYILVNTFDILLDLIDKRKVRFTDILEIIIEIISLYLICYIYI